MFGRKGEADAPSTSTARPSGFLGMLTGSTKKAAAEAAAAEAAAAEAAAAEAKAAATAAAVDVEAGGGEEGEPVKKKKKKKKKKPMEGAEQPTDASPTHDAKEKTTSAMSQDASGAEPSKFGGSLESQNEEGDTEGTEMPSTPHMEAEAEAEAEAAETEAAAAEAAEAEAEAEAAAAAEAVEAAEAAVKDTAPAKKEGQLTGPSMTGTAAVRRSAGLLDLPLFPSTDGTTLTAHGGGFPAVLGDCGVRLPWETATPRPHAAQAEDGVYVSDHPTVQPYAWAALQHRLATDVRPTVWLDTKTQQVVPTPNPLKADLSRPVRRFDRQAPYLQTVVSVPAAFQGRTEHVYQLDIELSRLELLTHPLQSEEDLYAARLLAAFREYKRLEASGLREFYAQKLHALHLAYLSEWERLTGDDGSGVRRRNHPALLPVGGTEHAAASARLATLREQVTEVSERRDAEDARAATSAEYMQALYGDIEAVRAARRFASTGMRLQMHKAAVDKTERATREAAEVKVLLAERQQGHMTRHADQVAAYTIAARKLENEIAVLKTRREVPTVPLPAEEELQDKLDDMERPPKDAPPFDTAAEKAKLESRLRKARGVRGGGHVPVLVSAVTSDDAPLDEVEQARRKRLLRTRFVVRLCANGQPVGATGEHLLGMDFVTDLPSVFSLQLRRWPDDVRLQILEKGLLTDTLVAEVALAVPGLDRTNFADPAPIAYHFDAQDPFQVPWTSVLPAKTPPESNNGKPQTGLFKSPVQRNPEVLFTSGVVYAKCAWRPVVDREAPLDVADVERAAEVAPPVPVGASSRRGAGVPAGVPGYVSKHQQAAWVAQALADVDPNDPRNTRLMEALHTQRALATAGTQFRLQLQDDLQLGPGGAPTESKRAQLMKERWHHNVQMNLPVPLLEADVDDRLLEKVMQLKRMKSGTAAAFYTKSKLCSFPLLEQALRMSSAEAATELSGHFHEFLGKVQARVERARRAASGSYGPGEKVVKLSDVVKDTPLPTFALDLSFITKLLAARRKLRPQRIERTVQATHPRSCEVLVNIQKAYNLPVRMRDGGGGLHEGAGSGTVMEADQLNAMVEVTFQGQKPARTSAVDGANPLWNEQLVLDYRPPNNDFSPQSLMASPDTLIISVYDEVLVAQADEEGAEPRAGYLRHYLGQMKVPISSVYRSQTVDGTFELQVPPVLLGYTASTAARPLLSVYICLSPNIMLPKSINEEVVGGEDDAMVRYAQKWQADATKPRQCKARHARALVMTSSGRSVFLPRFLTPLAPPDHLVPHGLAVTDAVLRRVLRFVSLVPPTPEWTTYRRRYDVWLTAEETLKYCMGDHEELAVLLCNFFLHLGVDASVVLGPGAQAPRSALVLTRGPKDSGATDAHGAPRLWSASSGRVFSATDDHMDLIGVSVLFTTSHLWANVQHKAKPWEVDWDVTNEKGWLSFFNKAFPTRQLASVQTTLPYDDLRTALAQYVDKDSDTELFIELQSQLEKTVKNIVSEYRNKRKQERQRAVAGGGGQTTWNTRCKKLLKKLLEGVEDAVVAPPAASSASMGSDRLPQGELAELSVAHHSALAEYPYVRGFPLCVGLDETSEEDLAEIVLRTRLADDHAPDIQFAVAALVVPSKVNLVCTVWLYLATLRKY